MTRLATSHPASCHADLCLARRPAAIRRTQSERSAGQAAVEFALVLPVAVVMAFAVVAVGVALRNELVVELAAREGARAASVSADPAGAASAAASRAAELPIEVATAASDATVTVTVTYVDAVDIAFVGWVIGPVTHRASVTMAVEPPDP